MTFSFLGINQTNASATNVFMGKVGIGTNNPAEQLHVLGNVRVDGTTIVAAINLGGQPRTNWPTVIPGTLVASSNLSDIGDPVAARANLGLGSAATLDASAFDAAGEAAAVGGALTTHKNDLTNPHQVTALQVDALTPTGDGSQLTGITAAQVGALSTNGGVVNGAISVYGAISLLAPPGDIPMGAFTNR